MSSRLFQEVRERQALVYSVHSGQQSYRDTGLFYVYAGTDAANFSKVVNALMKEIRGLKKDGVTADELRRSKEHLKGQPDALARVHVFSNEPSRIGTRCASARSCPWTRCSPRSTACGWTRSTRCIHRVLDEEQLSLLTLGAVGRRHLPRGLMRA